MLINEVYQLCLQLLAKNSGGGYFPPSEFSRYALLAQRKTIDELYQYLDYNQKVITLLSDVTKESRIVVSNKRFSRPSDYYKFHSANSIARNNQTDEWEETDIEYIGKSELGSRLRSKIIPPTTTYPVITEDESGFRVDPEGVGLVDLIYILNPEDPNWVALDPNVVPPVFDPSSSTDFVLSDKFTNILVNYISQMFGLEVNDQLIIQATVQNLVKTV